jgi:uncharacterized protein YjiS (DUF1127 family)
MLHCKIDAWSGRDRGPSADRRAPQSDPGVWLQGATTMNVELVNPMAVYRLFEHSDAAGPQPGQGTAPVRAKQLWARLGEEIRYQRAPYELHQLDDRELDDLDLARADLPALARRHAQGLKPLLRG